MVPALLRPAEIAEQDFQTFMAEVVKKDDFCVIDGKVEIKRDLALKLFALAKLSYDTQVVATNTISENEIVYICKAKVYKADGEKVTEGLGACSTKEVKGSRAHHDTLARAETRAFKRALEACVGLPFINEITLKLFGGYETPKGVKKETPSISPSEFIKHLDACNSIPHLKNVWIKYQSNLLTYDQQDKERVEKHKEMRKQELKG